VKKICPICKRPLFDEPLVKLENMPSSAQGFLTEEELGRDRGEELSVYQCSGCGTVQLACAPVPYYRKVIRACGFSQEMAAFRRKQFAGFIRKFGLENKKILEPGCGRGEFLAIMNEMPVSAYGIEYSGAAVGECLKKGLRVSRGFLEKGLSRVPVGPFDAFYMLSSLEHLPDINSSLDVLKDNLKPEACGLVEVPDFGMILKRGLFSEFIRDHLFYFSKDTLTKTLGINGFEVLSCGPVWHDYILSAEVRRKRPEDFSVLEKKLGDTASAARKLLNIYGRREIAVWGAGHQALAFISVSRIADRIKYIVDSAAFKQNLYSPASHIKIVSPDTLKTEPPEALIAMAGSYTGEICALMKENYPGIKVFVLTEKGLEASGTV